MGRFKSASYGGRIMFFKRLFKKRKEYEYCVNLSDITIKRDFKLHKPNPIKMYWKRKYYKENRKFESKILLNRDFELVDGYTSYLIAKKESMKYVDVYFVD